MPLRFKMCKALSLVGLVFGLLSIISLKVDAHSHMSGLKDKSRHLFVNNREPIEPGGMLRGPSNTYRAGYVDADLKVPNLLRKHGYPVEIHRVTSKDGYILTLHRIPHGKDGHKGNITRPVAFLQHGLLCSSAEWLMNTVEQALGYQLADIGYDVWLGNARGNTYSRSHISLSNKDKKFWNFSFHEMGKYDIPAVIDYILNETNEKDLYFIGHSLGTTLFFVAMSTNPEYSSKIRAMIALAPVAYLSHNTSPLRVFAPLAMQFEKAGMMFGQSEFFADNWVLFILQRILCRENFLLNSLFCENVLFLVCGIERPQLNETYIPVIMGHTPAGTSTKVFIHILQLTNSGEFRQFDYGRKENLEKYGSLEPPKYKLSSVKVPVAIFWGPHDCLSPKEDVHILAESLPNLIHYRKVKTFNHLDFLYAVNTNEVIYNSLIKLLQKY